MYRTASRAEGGGHEPSYWRRRAVVLAANLSLVGVLAWALSGGVTTLLAAAVVLAAGWPGC